MCHVVANSYLESADKDPARLEAYWMTVFAAGGPKMRRNSNRPMVGRDPCPAADAPSDCPAPR
jgi:hypothetical protein